LGRVIRNGRYFVRGRPIHETEFARDPEYPRHSSSVIELLGRPKLFPLNIARLPDPPPANGIVVGEAATARDLAQWAARRKPGTLCAGGSGFFDALLTAKAIRSCRGNEAEPAFSPRRPPPRGSDARKLKVTTLPELFICGTTSRSSREFLSAARRNRTPIFSLPRGLARGAAFRRSDVEAAASRAITALRSSPRVILTVGLPPVKGRAAGRRLAIQLVRVAAAVLRRAEIGHVYAEGGATAIALVRRMGWQRLIVRREAAPGVATLKVADSGSLLLTIKPGSYEWPAEIRH
jgi:uncharacterized protein YgbK (DUF1537 family)